MTYHRSRNTVFLGDAKPATSEEKTRHAHNEEEEKPKWWLGNHYTKSLKQDEVKYIYKRAGSVKKDNGGRERKGVASELKFWELFTCHTIAAEQGINTKVELSRLEC